MIAVNSLGLTSAATPSATGLAPVSAPNWRAQLPELRAGDVTLRELRASDAASLKDALTTAEVSRFISPPPNTVAGFERFIAWTHAERVAGRYVCFAIVPDGCDAAVGIFQVRQLGNSFDVAEWGFALAQSFWGSGIFAATAPTIVEFAIDTLKVHRLEARSAVGNGRGNGALQKIGATREGLLRKSFLKDGAYHDQVLWAILAHEWRLMNAPLTGRTH